MLFATTLPVPLSTIVASVLFPMAKQFDEVPVKFIVFVVPAVVVPTQQSFIVILLPLTLMPDSNWQPI